MRSTRVLSAIAVAWVTLERPGRAAEPIDYILPEARESRPEPQVVPGAEVAPGADDVVAYRSFDGHDYTLNRVRGKFVDVLAPDDWFGSDVLSPELARRLTDKLDLLYEQYRSVLLIEPPGPAKTTVAFVKNCGYGCGYVGYKGVEVDPGTGAKEAIIPLLRADYLDYVFLHEFAHNYDLFNSWLYNEGGDFAHAWTEWFDTFAGEEYNQAGNRWSPADAVRRQEHARLFEGYLRDPKRSWLSCFKNHDDSICAYPNGAWGATLSQFGEIHGDEAILRYLDKLRSNRLSNTSPPTTTEGRTDVHLRALAEAIQQNVACYADAWRWRISPELRQELADRFGAAASACLDVDGDGYRPVLDDCNDANPAIAPQKQEIAGNGIDEDCDARVDENEYREGRDWTRPFPAALPAQIHGKVTGNDRDSWEVTLSKPTWVFAEICSPTTFDGWLALSQGNGTDYLFSWAAQCSGSHYLLPAGKRGFEVLRYQHNGPYSVELWPSVAWPPAGWSTPRSAVVQGAQIVLKAPTAVGARFATPPTHVRFWVSGFGVVGERSYKSTTALRWTPPTPIPAGTTYRAQALTNGVPSTAYSQAAVVPPSSL